MGGETGRRDRSQARSDLPRDRSGAWSAHRAAGGTGGPRHRPSKSIAIWRPRSKRRALSNVRDRRSRHPQRRSRGALGSPPGTRVAGNLPYNISSPILCAPGRPAALDGFPARRHADAPARGRRPDRGQPGSGDYGPLAILIGLAARVERLMTLPPGAFRPPPKVTSAVVRLAFLDMAALGALPASLDRLVRRHSRVDGRHSATRWRRPTRSRPGRRRPLLLASAGLDGRRRPETLSPAEWVALARLAENAS